MKKLLILFVMISALSCDSKTKEEAAQEGGNSPGIQNANGNIPDTTNAINLTTSSSDKKDTSVSTADSVKNR